MTPNEFDFGLNQFIMAYYHKEYQSMQDSTKAKAKVIGILLEEVDKLVQSEQGKNQSVLYSLTQKPLINRLQQLRNDCLMSGNTDSARCIETTIIMLKHE